MAYNSICVGNHDGSSVYYTSSYVEGSGQRPEKPDIVARGAEKVVLTTGTHEGSGTSYSAAAVTGVLAQLMEGNGNIKVRPTLAKALLCAGARYWCGTQENNYKGIQTYSDEEGSGKLNAKCAASILTAGRYYYASGGTTENSVTCPVTISSSDAVIKICLTWEKRNRRCDSSSTPTLVNWNLKLRDPDGAVVYSSVSTVNNLEMIYFSPTEYGTYTIEAVRASSGTTKEYVSIAWY